MTKVGVLYKSLICVGVLTFAFSCSNKSYKQDLGHSDDIPQEKLDNPRGAVFKSATYDSKSTESGSDAGITNQNCETSHVYLNSDSSFNCVFNVPSGHDGISIHFAKLDTERAYDFVYLYDENNALAAMYHGNLGSFWSEMIPGSKVTLKFISDKSVRKYGFTIDQFAYGETTPAIVVPPVTASYQEVSARFESKHGIFLLPNRSWSETVTISQPGATHLQLHFKKIKVNLAGLITSEIIVRNKAGAVVKTFKKDNSNNYKRNFWMQEEIVGDTATVEFKISTPWFSSALFEYGFAIDRLNVKTTGTPREFQTKYPIILHHGIAGWDSIFGIDYFFRVKSYLKRKGFKVFITEVTPFGSLQTRTDQLKVIVDNVLTQTGASKVNIIAHSLGGLDARLLSSSNTTGSTALSGCNTDTRDSVHGYNYDSKIATLTTVATPHLGTRPADVGLGIIPGETSKALNVFFNLFSGIYNQSPSENDILASIYNLTEKFTACFNIDHPLTTNIAANDNFQTYAGKTYGTLNFSANHDEVNILLEPTYLIIKADSNSNHRESDGIVPLHSAIWDDNPNNGTPSFYKTYRSSAMALKGLPAGHMPADHFNQIGQILGLTDPLFDHREFYLHLTTEIINRED